MSLEMYLGRSIRTLKPFTILTGVLTGLVLLYVCSLWDYPASHVMGLFVGTLLFVTIIINPQLALWIVILLKCTVGAILEATTVWPGVWKVNIGGILDLLVIFAGIYYIISKKINLFDLPITKPYLLFITICFISILRAPDKNVALRFNIWITSSFMLYVMATGVLKNKNQIVSLIYVIFLSALIPISVGFYQMFVGTKYGEGGGFNRIYGTFGQPVPYGMYLMMIFPFALLHFLYHSRHLIAKYTWGFICLLLGVSLVLTYTRGAWFGVIVALIIIGFYYKKVLLLLPLLLVLLMVLLPTISGRLADLSQPVSEEQSSFAWRVNLWRDSLPMIKSNLLLGRGLGNFQAYSSLKIREYAVDAHNVYLQLAVETGLLGLGAFIWLLFSLGRNAITNFRLATDRYGKMLNIGFISIFAAFVTVCLADNLLEYLPTVWTLLLFAAITERYKRMELSSSTSTTATSYIHN